MLKTAVMCLLLMRMGSAQGLVENDECLDRYTSCEHQKNQNRCHDAVLWMKTHCPRTCGYCVPDNYADLYGFGKAFATSTWSSSYEAKNAFWVTGDESDDHYWCSAARPSKPHAGWLADWRAVWFQFEQPKRVIKIKFEEQYKLPAKTQNDAYQVFASNNYGDCGNEATSKFLDSGFASVYAVGREFQNEKKYYCYGVRSRAQDAEHNVVALKRIQLRIEDPPNGEIFSKLVNLTNTVELLQSRLNAQGLTLDTQGSTLKAQGLTLDTQGKTLKAQGSTLDTLGSTLKAQGSTLDTQGLEIDALRSRSLSFQLDGDSEGPVRSNLDALDEFKNFVVYDWKLAPRLSHNNSYINAIFAVKKRGGGNRNEGIQVMQDGIYFIYSNMNFGGRGSSCQYFLKYGVRFSKKCEWSGINRPGEDSLGRVQSRPCSLGFSAALKEGDVVKMCLFNGQRCKVAEASFKQDMRLATLGLIKLS